MINQTKKYWRGVNVSGAEFGARYPGKEGTDYTWDNERTYQYFAGQGFDLFRIPFVWDRIQHEPGGPLDEEYLTGLKNSVAWAKKYGGVAVIDLHNYARYHGEIIGKGSITKEHFMDIWTRLSTEFKDNDAVYAYGIMNEPHDMDGVDWDELAQAAVDAIRANGDNTPLTIPHDNWSGAHSWPVHKAPWIKDPANAIFYEAHQYFDRDSSGTYKKTYDEEMELQEDLVNSGVRSMQKLVEWSRTYNVKVFLGEFGIPSKDPRWLEVMDRFLDLLDAEGMDSAYWSTGIWWGDDFMTVHPRDDFKTPAPQLETLKKHLSR